LPNAAVKATEATAPEATEAATTASTRFMAGADHWLSRREHASELERL
jgi:hypothetical protein